MSSPTISEKVISANLFLRVVPLLFGGMCASFVCRNRGCHSKNLLPKRSAICLCQFPKAPILTLVGIQFNFFKSVVLGARMCKPLSYLVTGETAQDAERYSSLVFTAKGSPRKNCGSKHNQGGHVSAQYRKLEVCSSNCNSLKIQDRVCVLSATLSLFGNKPWCNPLEMTKEIKAQM